jgi:hypothetical protein
MPTLSIDELRRLIRKMEFDKTEPELLVDLVHKAMESGEGEKKRLKRIIEKSDGLFKFLADNNLFCYIKGNEDTMEGFKKIPVGAVDGSFQVVGGRGGKWFAILGISQIIADKGFTLNPTVKVDGFIEPLEAVDEAEAHKKSEIVMFLGEIKATRRIAEQFSLKGESYILVDGPVVDPPLYMDENYIDDRVEAFKFCSKNNVGIIGFVKRIMGSEYLNFIKKEFKIESVDEFANDLDLLSTVMFVAAKTITCPVYTYPLSCSEAGDMACAYKIYKEKGLNVYYSYYKPNLRSKIYRVEYASPKELSRTEVAEIYSKIFILLNKVWTLTGLSEPLPIIIAHNKCNVRQGAAEKLYYEIMTRALSEGEINFWLES